MENTKRSALAVTETPKKKLTPQYGTHTTILKPGLVSRSSTRRSIVEEDIKIDDGFDIPGLIDNRKRRLMINGVCISTIKVATYLLRDTIVNNWTDSTLVLIRYILSSFLLVLVTPLFVPRILRTYTVRSSLRLSVIGMIFIILTTYRPFPFIFLVQLFLCTFPESVLRVVVPLYMIRIARIWSQIGGIDFRTTILRVFALHNLLYQLRHILVATVKYIQPEAEESLNSLVALSNTTCGADYCERRSHLIVSYVYDVKYKNLDKSLIVSMAFAIIAAITAIGVTAILDRLDALAKSEFDDQPTSCKAIDVFLQLCRPRMSYLVGISLYHPFMTTLGQEYLEAYATCALAIKHDHMIAILVSLIALHAILSAEIFLDMFGMVRSIQLTLGTIVATFVILIFSDNTVTISIISIFTVYYMLQYWSLMYGLFVVLLTQRLIGDQEIAAWGIHTTVFYAGLTLSQAFRYVCMSTKLHIMIVFGIIVLFMTHFLRTEIKKTFSPTITKSTDVREFQRKNKLWITHSTVNLGKATDIADQILWIETFHRRTVNVVSRPIDSQRIGGDKVLKDHKKWFNLIERRAEINY